MTRPGYWFTSIDLEKGYFYVPIAAYHPRFLLFAFQGHHYQVRVLPFSLSLSSRVFSQFVAAALEPVQADGVRVLLTSTTHTPWGVIQSFREHHRSQWMCPVPTGHTHHINVLELQAVHLALKYY